MKEKEITDVIIVKTIFLKQATWKIISEEYTISNDINITSAKKIFHNLTNSKYLHLAKIQL